MASIEDLHTRSVAAFRKRGDHAFRKRACPLETWARDLRGVVDHRSTFLAAVLQLPPGEARGMALAGLVSGRPGSWEAAEVIQMAMADFPPLVDMKSADTPNRSVADVVSEWHTWRVDGGQVVADALADLTSCGVSIPDDSYFAGTSFAISSMM